MDAEIYDKAHDIMRSRREKAQTENDRRIREINKKIPEIKAINQNLFNTGRELIMTITNGRDNDITAEIEKIRQNNMEMQSRAKQLLISHGYPSDYLDTHYNCGKCSDTGYINNKFCDCMKQLCGELMAEKVNRNSRIVLTSFDDFDLKYYSGNDLQTMRKILDFARNYAENFSLYSDNIMMSGNTGLGKTHLSLAIADRVIRKDFAVIYDSSVNIFSKIERERYNHEMPENTLDAVIDADLLIIDDLGTEPETKFCNSMMFNIIDTRINRHRPTIISTNLSISEIAARYSSRTCSRLSTMYTQLRFSGDDVRLQRRKERYNCNSKRSALNDNF